MIETGLYLPPEASATNRRLRLLSIHDRRIHAILRGLSGDAARLARAYSGSDSTLESQLQLHPPGAVAAPWLFWETYQSLDDETFLNISEAGVCLLIASVINDHLADDQLPGTVDATQLAEALTARASILFEQQFPTDSEFWDHFERLTMEYRSALLIELRCRASPAQFTFAALKRTARGKICPGVITVAAMSIASAQADLLPALEESLKDVAVASQLVDDVHDWRADLAAGHLTYFLARLAPAEVWLVTDWPPTDAVERWVRVSQDDIQSLRRAGRALESAIHRVRDFYCPAWTQYIHTKRIEADQMLARVVAKAIVNRSQVPIESPHQHAKAFTAGAMGGSLGAGAEGGQAMPDSGESAVDGEGQAKITGSSPRSFRSTCELALQALLGAQRPDGSWIDFHLGDAGGSDSWVTAHIGLQLATLLGLEPEVERSQALKRAGAYLLAKWRHGWAYNDLAPVDADSTAHAVLFLHAIGAQIPPTTVKVLAAHQRPDGGFATYLEGRAERIPRSWCRSHPDVTPVVIQALSAIGEGPTVWLPINEALGKMASDREGDRPWPAFWWNLHWYTAAAWSRVMHSLGSECAGLQWPGDLSLEMGDRSMLDAALLLEVAIGTGREQLAREMVGMLTTAQLDSGLWPIQPILRQPSEGVERPWEEGHGGELYADIHGLYSAATILNRLVMFGDAFAEL